MYDSAGDLAIRKAGDEDLSRCDLVGGTDQGLAVLMECEAISTAQDGQRAEGFEAGGDPGQSVSTILEPLMHCVLRSLREAVQLEAGVDESSSSDQPKTVGQPVEVEGDFAAIRDRDLAGLAGRQRAAVGSEIGECHVDLMTDPRNHGHARARDGPGHGFFVEGPEVLQAATAAGHHDQIGAGDSVG